MSSTNTNANASIWQALARPFPDDATKSKPLGKGQQARYITARTVMNRLDEVLGPENWTAEYTPFGAPGSVLCRLVVLLPDGAKAVKCDVGQPGDGEDDKSAVSDALKRAAVQLGVGRYLYNDGMPRFYGGGEADPASEPAAAMEPAAEPPPHKHLTHAQPPTTGRGLWTFANGANAVKWFQALGSSWRYPPRIVDWTPEQVAAALHEYHAKQTPAVNGQAVGRWGGGR